MSADASISLNQSAVVAAGVFVASQLIFVAYRIIEYNRNRRNLARGLSSEIDKAIEISGLVADSKKFKEYIRDAKVADIVKSSLVMPYYRVYEQNVSNLGLLPSSTVSDIVSIYFLFTRMNAVILHIKAGGVDEETFESIKLMMVETVEGIEAARSRLDITLKRYL